MGLKTNSSNATFVKVVKGFGLVVRVSEGTEGAQARKIEKTGETVHELVFDELSGYMKEIKIREATFNDRTMKFWAITLRDSGQDYILSLPFSSRYSSSFLKRLPNVDLAAPIEVKCAHFSDDDRTVLWLTQEGVKVEQAYTREEPNGLPEMEQLTVKGDLVWDDTKMMNFLVDMVDKDIKPKLAELNKVESSEAPDDLEDDAEAPQTIQAETGDEEDELPF